MILLVFSSNSKNGAKSTSLSSESSFSLKVFWDRWFASVTHKCSQQVNVLTSALESLMFLHWANTTTLCRYINTFNCHCILNLHKHTQCCRYLRHPSGPSVTVCQGSKWSPCTAPHDQRGAMRSPLTRARFNGTAAKWRPFYSPLERAWEMRL